MPKQRNLTCMFPKINVLSPSYLGRATMKALSLSLAIVIGMLAPATASAVIVKFGPGKAVWRPARRPAVYRVVPPKVITPRPVIRTPRVIYRPTPPKVILVPPTRPLSPALRAAIRARREAELEEAAKQAVYEALQEASQ